MKKHKYKFFFYDNEEIVGTQEMWANNEEQARRTIENVSIYTGDKKNYTYKVTQRK